VDEQAIDLGRFQFEGSFERRDDGVDARHRQIVGQRAVAGDLDVILARIGGACGSAGDEDFVDIENLREAGGDAAQAQFEVAVDV
jgi:hypothetical protein